MMKILRVLRVVLVLLAAVVLYLFVTDLAGYVIRDDWRLARAVVAHGQNASAATQCELDDASSAFRRRRNTERAAMIGVLVVLCAGVVFTTRAIRAQPSNHAMERTSDRLRVHVVK